MMTNSPRASAKLAEQDPDSAATLLRTARRHDRDGKTGDAESTYRQAVRTGERSGEKTALIEALRRLGVLHHRRNERGRARELCRQSYDEAVQCGNRLLAGEALNALGGFEFELGNMEASRSAFLRALVLADQSPGLRGRIEQNLGVLDSVQGSHEGAIAHYRKALEAFEKVADDQGCATAYHNIGLVAARRGELEQAERALEQSARMADLAGDVHLRAMCELSRSEVSHSRRRYQDALHQAQAALALFDQLGSELEKSAAHKMIGVVLRDIGSPDRAEEHLRAAVSLALETGSVLSEAEAARELGKLHRRGGRTAEALAELRLARELFTKLEAKLEIQDVSRQIAELAA